MLIFGGILVGVVGWSRGWKAFDAILLYFAIALIAKGVHQ